MKNYSAGFTLIELMAVLTITAGAIVLTIEDKRNDILELKARALGAEMLSLNNAVRNFVAENPGHDQDYANVNFLKHVSCDGPASNAPYGESKAYLPCTWGDENGFTNQFSLRPFVSVGPDAAGSGATVGTTTFSALCLGTVQNIADARNSRCANLNDVPLDLLNLAVLSASSFTSGIYEQVDAATDADYAVGEDPATGVINGRLVVTATTMTNADAWLRTDGSNDMHADIRFEFDDVNGMIPLHGMSFVDMDPEPGQIIGVGRMTSLGLWLEAGLALTVDAVTTTINSQDVDINATRRTTIDAADRIELLSGDLVDIQAGNSIDFTAPITEASDQLVARGFYDRDDWADDNIANADWWIDPSENSRLQGTKLVTETRLLDTIVMGNPSNQAYTNPTRDDGRNGAGNNFWQAGDDGKDPYSAAKMIGRVDMNNLGVLLPNPTASSNNNRYVSIMKLLPSYVLKGVHHVRNGQYVPEPDCGIWNDERDTQTVVGTSKIVVVPTFSNSMGRLSSPAGGTTVVQVPHIARAIRANVASGKQWRIRVGNMRNERGQSDSELANDRDAGEAVAMVYCDYGMGGAIRQDALDNNGNISNGSLYDSGWAYSGNAKRRFSSTDGSTYSIDNYQRPD